MHLVRAMSAKDAVILPGVAKVFAFFAGLLNK